jgi:hypothetical protein
VSIELGHPQVTQDHVRALRLKCSQGVAAIACRRHDVPVSPEEPGERADQAGLIIKNHHASRGGRSHTHRRVTHQPWHYSEPSTSRKRVRPPAAARPVSAYCAYFTSHREVVDAPTKKGWRVGCISRRKTARCS